MGKRRTIERFRERLKWFADNLTPEMDDDGVIATPTDIYRALGKILKPSQLPTPRTWARYLESGSPSDQVLAGLRVLYPQLNAPHSRLLAEAYADFELTASGVRSTNARWEKATKYFSANRHQVELFGKAIYRDLDELSELPLIGKRSWLPSHPIELRSDSGEPTFWRLTFDNTQQTSLPLDGLSLPYHVLKRRSRGKRDTHSFNGNCFIVKGIDNAQGTPRLEFGQGKFFDYVNTCEAHAALIADMIIAGAVPDDIADVDQLAYESGWKRERIFEWNSRTAFLGVNCALILSNFSGGNVFLLHRRSSQTLEAQKVWHVVPAGGHQPLNSQFIDPAEQNIWHTAARELLEEVFDCDNLTPQSDDQLDRFADQPKARRLFAALFESGATKIHFMGIGLDPATTKPEALLVTLIDWEKANEAYYRLASKPLRSEFKGNWEGSIATIPLSRAALTSRASQPRWGETMLPAGAACLMLLANHFDVLRLRE